MSARLADSAEGRRAAEHMAARLCTQVQELRTFGIAAVVGRIAVSSENLHLLLRHRLTNPMHSRCEDGFATVACCCGRI